VGIKRNIQRTIEFLRSPTDSPSASARNSSAEEHCVRGLECLAEDFVNDHKRRVQKASKSAVFRFQQNRRRKLGKTRSMMESKDDDEKSRSIDEAHEASMELAELYKKSTSQCEHIAKRWGHFDAIDADIDPVSSSPTAVTCATEVSSVNKQSTVDTKFIIETPIDNNASLSSLSYDGDDGEEEEENESNDDFNLPPVVDARKPAHGFDSLPDGLFNF